MNFYDGILDDISALINDKSYKRAMKIIDRELSMPYVPKDIEKRLIELASQIPCEKAAKSLSESDIIDYLKLDEEHQLRAVDELNKYNLRDYIEICNDFLSSDGFINAKVLLVYSLIQQEIGEEIQMVNNGIEYKFIPKYIMIPENTFGFKKAVSLLEKEYMKEPSKLELAKQLAFKECLLALPINYDEDDAKILSNKVIEYIDNAFNN